MRGASKVQGHHGRYGVHLEALRFQLSPGNNTSFCPDVLYDFRGIEEQYLLINRTNRSVTLIHNSLQAHGGVLKAKDGLLPLCRGLHMLATDLLKTGCSVVTVVV